MALSSASGTDQAFLKVYGTGYGSQVPVAEPTTWDATRFLGSSGARGRRSTGEDVLTYCAIGTLAEADQLDRYAELALHRRQLRCEPGAEP